MPDCEDTIGKQGLGYDAIIDNRSLAFDFGVKIEDPSDLENEQTYIANTHSKTVGNKSEQPDELGDPLARNLSVFYNASNVDLLQFLKRASRTVIRDIVDVHPRHPNGGSHNAFIKACGFVNLQTISNPLDALATGILALKFQDADDIVEQQNVVAPVEGDSIISLIETVSANIVAGTVLATLTDTYASGLGLLLNYLVSGTGDTDNATVEIVGDEIRALGPIGADAGFSLLVGMFNYPGREVFGENPVLADTEVTASKIHAFAIT